MVSGIVFLGLVGMGFLVLAPQFVSVLIEKKYDPIIRCLVWS